MDYVNPKELVQDALMVAEKKASLTVSDMLIRGTLSGVFLGFATSLAVVVTAQGLPTIVGAILFPVGLVMLVLLVLLGLELATGNFAVLPMAVAAGKVSYGGLLRNWGWVYAGNLIGSLLYAILFYVAVTNAGMTSSGAVGAFLSPLRRRKPSPIWRWVPKGGLQLSSREFCATGWSRSVLCLLSSLARRLAKSWRCGCRS